MDKFSTLDGFSVRAFTIYLLQAARVSETIKATWGELDLEEGGVGDFSRKNEDGNRA